MSKVTWYICILFPLLVTGWMSRVAPSAVKFSTDINSITQLIATPTPTQVISIPTVGSLQPRVLPAVGGNAGLVIGASILVLIIIGGVIFSSRKKRKG